MLTTPVAIGIAQNVRAWPKPNGSQTVVPIGLCTFLQVTRGLAPGDIWLAIVLGHFTRALLSVIRFRQGRWRSIAVDIEPARP